MLLLLRSALVLLGLLCVYRESTPMSAHAASTVNMSVAAHKELHNLYRKFNETAMNLGQKLRDGLIQKSFGNLATLQWDSGKLPYIYADELQSTRSDDVCISTRMEHLLYSLLWVMLLIDCVLLASVLWMCKGSTMEFIFCLNTPTQRLINGSCSSHFSPH